MGVPSEPVGDASTRVTPHVEIHARLNDDLRTVEGTFTVTGLEGAFTVVDPLGALPDPPSDLHSLRTFPGVPSHGRVSWTGAHGTWRFTARLPERFGPYGATGLGTFANGGWYPQLLTADGIPVVDWHVELTAPPGIPVVVGGVLGEGVVWWDGRGDRAPLAAVPGGHRTPIAEGVTYLSRGRPGRRVPDELRAAVTPELRGVIVEAPLRRRLTADGPSVTYLSDRAFRLTPGLRFAHRTPVRQGLVAGLSGIPDDFERDLVAAAAVATDTGPRPERLLGRFRWVPQINALLSSNRIAFWSETTGQVWPADPVVDDLTELYDPHWAGAAAWAAAVDTWGAGAAAAFAASVRDGAPDPALDAWRGAPPHQDYVLEVSRSAVVLDRQVTGLAPPEPVILRIDGVDHRLTVAPGPLVLPQATPPREVVLDPGHHLLQESRVGDRWPPRYDVTFAGWIDGVNLTRGQVWLGGQSTVRRWYDTHNLLVGSVYNTQSDLVGLRVGAIRKEGPLLDGLSRPLRLRLDVGSSLLDPAFSPTEGLALTLDSAASIAWDDRVSADFPLRGNRIAASVGTGGIPGSSETWFGTGLSALAVASPHPRVAFAARASTNLARSPAAHRLLLLGGDAGIRAIPALPACPTEDGRCLPVATERALGVLEIRTAPVRNASVPGVLGWGTELQVTVGFEGLLARVDGAPVTGTGVTIGLLGLADVLGVDAMGLGLTAAFRTSTTGLPLPAASAPELYLRFGQNF